MGRPFGPAGPTTSAAADALVPAGPAIPAAGRAPRRRRRRRVLLAAAVVVALLLPVPWLHVSDSWGMAWGLDNRLVVNGRVVDPPGRWSWLTVGRPPLVVELLRDRLLGTEDPPRDMRQAPAWSRPSVNEPLAAAVGLRHAGKDLELGLLVQGVGPDDPAYPDDAVVVEMNGVALTDQGAWDAAVARAHDPVEFRTADGRRFTAPGTRLPYAHVSVMDLAPEGVDAAIGGQLDWLPFVQWFRGLALGRSHGLMVALTTYAAQVDEDLADGRHIAGTGGIRGDGTVTRIGGLPQKAAAARRHGADVLLFPAVQADELADFDAGDMQLVAVTSLADAIAQLRGPTVADGEDDR